jgi:hypothetical protein
VSESAIVRALALLLLVACARPLLAAESALDVQRQLRERERSDIELRLKMQQQRPLHPAPAADSPMRDLQRDRQVRQRELLDERAREASARELAPDTTAGALEQNRRMRIEREAAEQARRFRMEREGKSSGSAGQAPP